MTSQMNNLYQPLDDDEIAWLGEFLLDRIDDDADTGDRDEGILDISELDGFLTAVVSGPVTVLPSQWIPQVWGDFEPVWEREQDVQKVMTLLMRHMNAIAVMLKEQPEDFEPIFLERSGRSGSEPAITAVGWLPEIAQESLPNGRFLVPRPAGTNTELSLSAGL